MIQFFRKRPWLIVVAAFALLISAWSSLIVIAVRNQPETIQIEADPK